MRVGRFGWKAQHATLLGIASDAYLNEMGITNRFFPTEKRPEWQPGAARRIR
ncbi:MAG: di-heme oxidoredictase family protein [Chthoniobacter sp.]